MSSIGFSGTLETLDGAYIGCQVVNSGVLSSGDNNVDVTNITKLPVAVIPFALPDGVVCLVKSFSIVSGSLRIVVNAAAAAATGIQLLVLGGTE